MVAQHIVVGCFIFLGIAHSVLGEQKILCPLFSSDWRITQLPRRTVERVLRFSWHLTTLFWFAIAATILGTDLLLSIGVALLASALLVFIMLRGHLAWPVFLLGGLAAFHATSPLPQHLLLFAATVAGLMLTCAAAIHVYWAFGGTWCIDRALPTRDDVDVLSPSRTLTLVIALLLAVFAGLVLTVAIEQPPLAVRWLVGVGATTFVLRAIGDTKFVGFTKTVRSSAFATADDKYFTPIIVFIALGAVGALLV